MQSNKKNRPFKRGGYHIRRGFSFRFDDLLYFLYDSFEGFGVVQSQVGQHLAVEFDTGFLQTAHQHRIGHPVSPGSCADTHDPQSTEIALFLFAVAVSVNQTFFDGVLGYRPNVFPRTVITFGQLEDLFAALARSDNIY